MTLIELPKYSIQPKAGNYYAVFRWLGKPKWCPLKTKTKHEASRKAKDFVKAYIGNLIERQESLLSKTIIAPPNSLKSEIQKFIQSKYVNKKKARKTLDSVKSELESILEYAPGILETVGVDVDSSTVTVNQLSEEIFGGILGWYKKEFEKRNKRPISDKSLDNVLKIWGSFFKFEIERGIISKNPISDEWKPDLSKYEVAHTTWTQDEFQGILDIASDEDKELLTLIRYTGMYPSDIYEFKFEHVLSTPDGNLKIFKMRSKAKGVSERIDQPLSRDVRYLFEKYLAKTVRGELLFNELISRYQNPSSFTTSLAHRVKTYWDAYSGETVHKNVRSLRHTFASRMAEQKVDSYILRKWMGHSPKSRTLEAIYLHLDSTAQFLPENTEKAG